MATLLSVELMDNEQDTPLRCIILEVTPQEKEEVCAALNEWPYSHGAVDQDPEILTKISVFVAVADVPKAKRNLSKLPTGTISAISRGLLQQCS